MHTIQEHNPMATIRLGMQGNFEFTVRREGEVVQSCAFPNLILNQGREKLGTDAPAAPSVDQLGFCQIGTGTSVPTVTQTQLDASIGGVAKVAAGNRWSVGPSPTYIQTCVFTYVFPKGSVIGTITEVGIGWATTGATLFSRAQVKDGNGNPIGIPLTSIDELTVTYAISLVKDLTPLSSSLVLDGNTYNYTVYTTNVNSSGNYYSLIYYNNTPYGIYPANGGSQINFYPAGTPLSPTVLTDTGPSNATSIQYKAYTYTYYPGTYTAKNTISMGKSEINLAGGIQCFVAYFVFFGCVLPTMFYFSTPIPKTNVHQLVLEFDVSWA